MGKNLKQSILYLKKKEPNQEKWIKDIWYGLPPRTMSYLHPSHWSYNHNLKDPGYDPKKAAEMLEGAGWKVGSDGIREKNGVKLKFSMSTTAGSKAREQAQAMIQANWKEIGVEQSDLAVLNDLSEVFKGFAGEMVPFNDAKIEGSDDRLSGFPVKAEYYEDGNKIIKQEVKEIRKEDLDASLFELPEGFEKKDPMM